MHDAFLRNKLQVFFKKMPDVVNMIQILNFFTYVRRLNKLSIFNFLSIILWSKSLKGSFQWDS